MVIINPNFDAPKTCPFCGSENVRTENVGGAFGVHFVQCLDCYAEGPQYSISEYDDEPVMYPENEALRLWNQREETRLRDGESPEEYIARRIKAAFDDLTEQIADIDMPEDVAAGVPCILFGQMMEMFFRTRTLSRSRSTIRPMCTEGWMLAKHTASLSRVAHKSLIRISQHYPLL